MFDTETRKLIRQEAERLSIHSAALFAVIEVESAGVSVWKVEGRKLPPIRFEGHYFYRRLHGAKRQAAIRQGLAHKTAGRVKNPRSYGARYALLDRAMKIDRDAALESISMGLGQVMGAHWLKLGYQSVEHMWTDVCASVAGQVRAMILFIEANKLVRHLRTLSWHKFARAYNGIAYRKNRYAQKMASAYARHNKAVVGGNPEWTKHLEALGYGGPAYEAVKVFQSDHGLVVDGIVGPMTLEALDDAMEAKRNVKRARVKTGLATVGTGIAASETSGQTGIVETMIEKSADIEQVAGMAGRVWGLVSGIPVPWLLGAVVLCVGGYLAWHYYVQGRDAEEGLFA